MAVKRRKASPAEKPEPPAVPRPKMDEEEPEDDLDFSGVPAIADVRAPNEPDPREVENVTDRIFASVLSRYGWERHNGRIVHVGEPHQHRR